MSKASGILGRIEERDVKNVKLKVKVPSFTFSSAFRVAEYSEEERKSSMIKQPVSIELETFENDVEKVLDVVITKAIVDAFNKAKLTSKPLTDRKSYIGGHSSDFPNHFNVEYK